ncbi:hypothetical protein VDGD_20274 [Verticillium dahliae]|nr:hypothetical protein VDGD_20274 [Verticillium dahliae]
MDKTSKDSQSKPDQADQKREKQNAPNDTHKSPKKRRKVNHACVYCRRSVSHLPDAHDLRLRTSLSSFRTGHAVGLVLMPISVPGRDALVRPSTVLHRAPRMN